MSNLPAKPSLDLSLPPRPHISATTTTTATKSATTPSLLSRLSTTAPTPALHGLPAKPVIASPPVRSAYSPPPREPDYLARGSSYYRSRSPSPGRSDWDRLDTYRPRPASPRRSDWDRTDSYVARRRTPSPPPPSRYRERRYSGYSQESRSPVRLGRSPSPPPIGSRSFHSHSRRDSHYADRQIDNRGGRAEDVTRQRKNEDDEASWASYRQEQRYKAESAEADKDKYPKRSISSLQSDSQQPSPKYQKSIPTGPRTSSPFGRSIPEAPTGPRISTGPSLQKSVPTGPRALSTTAASSQSTSAQLPPKRTSRSPSPLRKEYRSINRSPSPPQRSDISMPSHRGGHSNGRGRSNAPKRKTTPSSSAVKQLDGPFHDRQFIESTYGAGVAINPNWEENPKSPLTNHLGHLGTVKYEAQEGFLERKKIIRVSVVADEQRGIIGIGDATTKKEAEYLAALSAILQLSAAGLLSQKSQSSGQGAGPISSSSSQTAKLTDGSEIDYERARQFMEYYCKRYKFDKPHIEFSEAKTKSKKHKGGASTWDAVITVGGRKIGVGSATKKKDAQIQCFLDVTQYLESCDRLLWQDFLDYTKNDKSANLGMAPHLVFQMSDHLNEDIYGLCGDIRNSTLIHNAPQKSVAAEGQVLPSWSSAKGARATPKQLQEKSDKLKEKLAEYQIDPKMEKMRASRDSLPVKSKAVDILTKIEINDVTIIMAATGSGKTTQIPQLIFDDYINRGEGAKCNVLCTQPRRLAATSVAERIADERGDRLGGEVGYQVRFDTKLPQPNGSITFCTTGIFLKRMQSSLGANANADSIALMDQVTHIVVDEVHERDIDTDLSLVVLKQLLADRKARKIPLKIILMSATIDPTLFQKYFLDERGRPAPVAEIPGRTFPVTKHYLDEIVPILRDVSSRREGWVWEDKTVNDYLSRELSRDPSLFMPNTGMDLLIPFPLVAMTIAHVLRESDDGHVLVFMPGWDEIKKVADILLNTTGRTSLGTDFNDSSKYSLHYLHSTIPAAEQREVFQPPPKGVRRIILATNIAETSITIPDVVYVVDTGRVKEKRYDPDRHMSSLVSAWVGSSNLNQRAGRAGRHREGEYYGLISNARYKSLDPHQLVEMKRSDLSNVVMHVKALNLGEVEDVLAATIEPPEPARIVAAMQSLHMLGAMDEENNLTSLGRVLLQLPVDAAIGKLCLYGSFFRCLDSALTLAAILTSRDPFMAPPLLKVEANRVKDSWSPLGFRSDVLASVAAYNAWVEMENRRDYRAASQFCSENFLSKQTLLQIKQVKESLLQSLDQTGVIAVSAGGNNIGRVRRFIPPQLNEHGQSLPLLAALIAMASAPNFAIRRGEHVCRTAQDKSVIIHPSSVNSNKREAGGPEEPSASFNPAEKRLYAFTEKSRNIPASGKPENATTHIRNVTRLDPMTYMLFGAYQLVVTQRGLECDSWLPVVGNLHALDDIQRLKTLLDRCMLRVFEGVGKSLVEKRDQRWVKHKETVHVNKGISRIDDEEEDDGADEGENESDEEEDAPSAPAAVKKRVIKPLGLDEVRELEMLTTDVVRILDAYAAEREGGSTLNSRPATPGLDGGLGHGGQGVYRPPATRRY